MKAVLRGLHSPDVPDLGQYVPTIPDEFGFLLQIFAGPDDGDGEESFDVLVCTPAWLCNHHARTDIVIGRHHMILFEYNYPRLVDFVTQYVNTCEGPAWEDVAEKLGRLGKWEFEDYQPSTSDATAAS
jgi:hypothetical protein